MLMSTQRSDLKHALKTKTVTASVVKCSDDVGEGSSNEE